MDLHISGRSPPNGTLSNTFCITSRTLYTRSMLVAPTGRFRSADLPIDIDGCDACIRQLLDGSRRGSSPAPSPTLARSDVVEVCLLPRRRHAFGIDTPSEKVS